MDKSVFLDTAYLLALVIEDDKHHKVAISLKQVLTTDKHFEQAGFERLLK